MKLRNMRDRIIYSIKNFNENRLENVSTLMPVVMVAMSIVLYITQYIVFIVKGGYKEQVNLLKENGVDGIMQAFSLGDFGTTVENIDTLLLNCILLVGVCLVMYMIIVKQETKKRNILIVDIIILAVLGCCYFLFDLVNGRKIRLSQEQEEAFIKFIFTNNIEGIPILFIVFGILFIISVGVLLYFALRSEYRDILKMLCVASVLSYAGIPLFFLLLKNIIPLLSGIVALVLIYLLCALVMKMIVSGLSSENGSCSQGGTYGSNDNYEKRKQVKPLDIRKPDNNMYVVPSGVMLHKVRGSMHDYIERSTSLSSSEVCSLADLQKGKFLIYDSKGRRLGENDIPWK